MKTQAFPDDEALSEEGLRELRAAHTVLRPARRSFTAPEQRCRQTAVALGVDAVVAPALRECDYGRWANRTLPDVAREDPAGVEAWLTDVGSAPHGGESLAALLTRVADWLGETSGVAGRAVAFTHVSVVRAAIVHVLGAPLASFWQISIGPLTCAGFTHHNGRWRLGALVGPRDFRTSNGLPDMTAPP